MRLGTRARLTALVALAPFFVPELALAAERRALSQLIHRSWSAREGLPAPVRALAQTPDGYLWVGTEAGLYRFDGVRFTAMDSGGEGHPHSPTVLSLLAARDGNLWVGFGSGGVARLLGNEVTHFSEAQGTPPGSVQSLAEDASGAIWAASEYGLSRLVNGRWDRIGTNWSYDAPGAQSLLVDADGTLWVATDGREFPNSPDSVRRNRILTLPKGATRFVSTREAVGMVRAIINGPDRTVWVAETSGNEVRRFRGGQERPWTFPVQGPMCLQFANDGSLWVGLLDHGLGRHGSLAPGSLERFDVHDRLSGPSVLSILKDREGTVWVGTSGGLDSFTQPKVAPFSEAEGLSPDQRLAVVATPDGTVWFAGYSDDVVSRYRDGRFVNTRLPRYDPSETTRILAMYTDPAGQLWLGGSFQLAYERQDSFSFLRIPGVKAGSMVEGLAQDRRGDLWVTLTGGDGVGRILHRRAGQWSDARARFTLPPYRARVLLGDSGGRIWLGFENGEVAVLDNERLRTYSAADGLRSRKVLLLAQDRRGRIWAGGDSGLARLDGERFVTLTEASGLPGSSVSALVEDDRGDVWIAGSLGILRVSPEELDRAVTRPGYRMKGMLLDASDGLRGLPRQREPFPTAARATNGLLWFSTNAGAAAVDPAVYATNPVPPPVTIERLVVDDRVAPAVGGTRLPPGTRSVEFQYAGLSLVAPEKVRFRYKLEGHDPDWRGPVAERSATYTNLPPGTFRFRVLAANDDGLWNEAGATLDLTLEPAFHQTRVFLFLCTLLVGALLWTAYRLRLAQVRSRIQLQFRERFEERTRIAQELHDTLFQGFLSASMQLHVAAQQLPGESSVRAALDRILGLMKGVIDQGRSALKTLRSADAGREDLEHAFSHVREELPGGREIDFRILEAGKVRPLDPNARDEVYRIGREALLNAFRHSGASHVEVEIEFARKGLRVAVRDDGRGIAPDFLSSGRDGHFGLVGMHERARSLGGRLRIWSREGGGTEVELAIPARVAFQGQASPRR